MLLDCLSSSNLSDDYLGVLVVYSIQHVPLCNSSEYLSLFILFLCTVISRAGGFGSTNSIRFGQQTDSIHHIVNLDTLQCGEWGLPPEKIIKYQTPVGLS